MSTRPNLPSTSLEANRKAVPEMRREHYQKILSALGKLRTANYEQIATIVNLDKHQVGRRMSELQAMGKVYKPGVKTKTISGREAFNYCLTSEPEMSPAELAETIIENIKSSQPKKTTKKSKTESTIIQQPFFNI